MPHTRSHLPLENESRTGRAGRARGEIYEPGRHFVPGVAAGICRRPNDRPKAETHPPNASINVCLVNSGVLPESWRLIWFVPCPVSLNDPAEPTGYWSCSVLSGAPPRRLRQKLVPLTVPCGGRKWKAQL